MFTNTGDITLTNVFVIDNIYGAVTLGTTTLAPGQSTTGTVTHVVTVSDIPLVTNTATANGTDPLGDYVTDSDSCTIAVAIAPGIHIDKAASKDGSCPGSDPLLVQIGDTVTYCYNVTNTGDVTLTNVSVSDNRYGAIPLGSTTLAPGASTTGTTTHVVTESDIPRVTNIATANGTDPVGDTITDSDDCTINVKIAPRIHINKTASTNGTCPGSDPLLVQIGDTITYCYNVMNTGDVSLTNVSVSDNIYGSVTLGTTTLAPGETTGGTVTHVVVESDAPSVTDIATATGTHPVGDQVTDTDDCTINVAIAPGICVTKTASPPGGPSCTDITFTITVTNAGDCLLDPVMVVDTLPAGMSYVSSSPAADSHDGTITWNNVGPLVVGASKTIKLVAHIDEGAGGMLENVVCVTGTPLAGADVHDCDTAEIEVLAPTIEPPQQTLIDVTTEIKSDRTVIEEEQFGWETGNGNLLNNPPLAPGEAVGGIKYAEKMIGSNGTTEFTKCFNVNTNVTPNLGVTKDIGYKSGDLGSLSHAEQVGMRYYGASPPLSSNTKCEDVNAYSKMVVTDVEATTETEVGITETDERNLLYEIDAEGNGTVSAGVDASVEDGRSADAPASSWTYEEKSIGYGNFTFRKEIGYTSNPP